MYSSLLHHLLSSALDSKNMDFSQASLAVTTWSLWESFAYVQLQRMTGGLELPGLGEQR
jgi:hypothetical protein